MAKWAYIKEDQQMYINTNEEFSLCMKTSFWDVTDNTITEQDPQDVYVVFAAGANAATINTAITDGIIAHANTAWSWTIPRENILFRQLARDV